MVEAMKFIWAVLFPMIAACVSASERDNASQQFGVQLYHLREQMAEDPLATLRRVSAMGFASVEYVGSYSLPPDRLCQETRRLGLDVAAVHTDWRLLRDDPETAVAQAKAACSDTIMLAWIPPEERATTAQWREWAGYMNRAARIAEQEGLAFAYHPHDFEFVPRNGVRPIDILLEVFHPWIAIELDTYWAAKGGQDPLEFLVENAGRITHVHLKDIDGVGAMADVGSGLIEFEPILAEARRQGVRHYLVERDDAPDPWDSLASSLDSLLAMPLHH